MSGRGRTARKGGRARSVSASASSRSESSSASSSVSQSSSRSGSTSGSESATANRTLSRSVTPARRGGAKTKKQIAAAKKRAASKDKAARLASLRAKAGARKAARQPFVHAIMGLIDTKAAIHGVRFTKLRFLRFLDRFTKKYHSIFARIKSPKKYGASSAASLALKFARVMYRNKLSVAKTSKGRLRSTLSRHKARLLAYRKSRRGTTKLVKAADKAKRARDKAKKKAKKAKKASKKSKSGKRTYKKRKDWTLRKNVSQKKLLAEYMRAVKAGLI